jgi:hypothetical protein
MANYTKATNFLAKDSLATGDPAKIIKGSEFDTEFNALQTAVNSKANIISPAFTGTPTAPTAASGTNTTQLATTEFVVAKVSTLGTMSTQNATAVAITGGTIAGTTINGNVVGTNSVGARTISTSAPAGGSNGDIWYRY